MNKKIALLIALVAAGQSAVSCGMFKLVSAVSVPDDIVGGDGDSSGGSQVLCKQLEEDFKIIWKKVVDRAKAGTNSQKLRGLPQLGKADAEKLIRIFTEFTKEKFPEIIKVLNMDSGYPFYMFLGATIASHSHADVAYLFFSNKELLRAVFGKKYKKKLRCFLEGALKGDAYTFIQQLVRLGTPVEEDDLLKLFRNKDQEGFATLGGVPELRANYSFWADDRPAESAEISDSGDSAAEMVEKKGSCMPKMPSLYRLVKILVKHGAGIDVAWENGGTVLRSAFRKLFLCNADDKQAVKIIGFLLKKGVDLDPKKINWGSLFVNGAYSCSLYGIAGKQELSPGAKRARVRLIRLFSHQNYLAKVPWAAIIQNNDFDVFSEALIRLGKPFVASVIYAHAEVSIQKQIAGVGGLGKRGIKKPEDFLLWLAKKAVTLAAGVSESNKKSFLKPAMSFLLRAVASGIDCEEAVKIVAGGDEKLREFFLERLEAYRYYGLNLKKAAAFMVSTDWELLFPQTKNLSPKKKITFTQYKQNICMEQLRKRSGFNDREKLAAAANGEKTVRFVKLLHSRNIGERSFVGPDLKIDFNAPPV